MASIAQRTQWHVEFAQAWASIVAIPDPAVRRALTHLLRLDACTAALADDGRSASIRAAAAAPAAGGGGFGQPAARTVPLGQGQRRESEPGAGAGAGAGGGWR